MTDVTDDGRTAFEDDWNDSQMSRHGMLHPPTSRFPLARIALEYVTFGNRYTYLLKVLLLQFTVMFLDVGFIEYTVTDTGPGPRRLAAGLWLLAAVVFLVILAVTVREMCYRTLSVRLHLRRHVVVAITGFVFVSSVSFGFGYATLIFPVHGAPDVVGNELLPSVLTVLGFSTFLAIGSLDQISAEDRPTTTEVDETIGAWLETLSWVEEPPNSLERSTAYDEFRERTDDLRALLREARTLEGMQLAAEFSDWERRLDAHSLLSQEMVVAGSVREGALTSRRLAAEHRDFADLRERLETVGGGGR